MVLVYKERYIGLRESVIILCQKESVEARQRRFMFKKLRGNVGSYQQPTMCSSTKQVELQNYERLLAIHDVFEC